MKKLSDATLLPQSGIRRMFDLAKNKEDTISFVLGEPDFDTPKNVIKAAQKALEEGQTHYTDNAGILPLRQAIARETKKYDHVAYNPENEILVCTGGMEALYLSMATLLDPGDEVLISDPCYANYYGQISMNHGVPVPVPVYEENGFNFTYEALSEAVTDKTKVILLNSPCNPTGAVAGRKVMEDIAKVALEHDLYVVYDAVYKHLLYEGEYVNIAALDGMKNRTIYIDSCSKTYAMTGWRIGYLAGPREIVSLMPKLQENVPSCVTTFAQYGAVEALNNGQASIKEMYDQYEERRKVLLECIEKIGKISCRPPKGAFYAFINIKETGLGSTEFAEQLLEKEGVVAAPGSAFGEQGEGYIRISYATSVETIRKGMARIQKFVESL